MTDILDDSGGQRSRGPAPEHESEAPAPAEERIAKVIARAGIASRRDAEALIAAGRVTLNGALLTSPALNVGPEARITVDGELLPSRERTRLWLFHKPRGLVTTFRDPEGRPTVFDALPEDMPRVVAIGRLDMNTEGLLLLTNDGGLAKVVAHPDTGWTRRYRVRAYGEIEQTTLDRLRSGITIDGMEYGAVEAMLDRQQGDNSWITLALREGKNREVKRILEHLGLQVNRLLRLSFGPFQLGDLEPGLVEEVRTRVLKDQLGAALAMEAGVDFESPVRSPIAPFGAPIRPARPGRVPEPRRASEAADRERSRGRDERSGRPAGPGHFARGGEQPRFRPSGDGPKPSGDRPRLSGDRPRPSGDRPRPVGGERTGPPAAGRPRVGDRGERRPTEVWRPDREEDGGRPKRRDRREDPKTERAAAAERPRERATPIERGGRRVMVERLVAAPGDDAPPRSRGRDEGPGSRRPARPDRAGPPREARDGAKPGRPPREGARPDRPWQGKPPRDGERPRFDRGDRPDRGERPGAAGGRPPAARGEERPRSGFGRPGGGAGRGAPAAGRGGPPGRSFGADKGRPFGADKGRPFGADKGRPFGAGKGRPPSRPPAGKPAFGAKRPPRSGPPRSGPPGRGPRSG